MSGGTEIAYSSNPVFPAFQPIRSLPDFHLQKQQESMIHAQSLTDLMANVTEEYADEIPFTAMETPCCPNPPTCPERLWWQAQFKGCQTSYTDSDNPEIRCEVAPIPDRYKVADLNELLFERSIATAAEWNPYEHMNARQLFIQFINADMGRGGDPYSRPVKKMGESYCALQSRRGPPPYTTF